MSVFIGGYFYLNSILDNSTVSENVESVPYYSSTPENAGILLNICEEKVYLYLDFGEEILNVIFPETDINNYGYGIDYTINCNYEIVGYLVDLVGGIELENIRYTGVQITELYEFSNTSDTFKRETAQGIITGIAETGVTKEDLLYIIENSDTNLKFNECFSWAEYMGPLCNFPRFIN